MGIKDFLCLLATCALATPAHALGLSPVAGVIASKNNSIHLYTSSQNIQIRQKLSLLDASGKITCCFEIGKKFTAAVDSPLSDFADAPIYVYRLTLHGKAVTQFQESQPFGAALRRGAKIAGAHIETYTIEYAGEKTLLRLCTSSEGVHFISSKPGQKQPLSHLYYYLGYDVEPSCDSLPAPNADPLPKTP